MSNPAEQTERPTNSVLLYRALPCTQYPVIHLYSPKDGVCHSDMENRKFGPRVGYLVCATPFSPPQTAMPCSAMPSHLPGRD